MKWEYHEGPYRGSLYGGLPMVFVMAFLIFGFLTLFVSDAVKEVLFVVMLGVIAVASVLAVVGWLKHRR
jgi:amino acid permease